MNEVFQRGRLNNVHEVEFPPVESIDGFKPVRGCFDIEAHCSTATSSARGPKER